MHLTTLLSGLIGLASLTTAQTMTLSQVLSSQNATLSTLNSLLASQPALLRALTTNNTQGGLTILAPSNSAFSKVLSTPAGMALAANSGMVAALLEYHVLSGTFPASAFTSTAQFIPTLMSNASFTGVTGGQVVMAVLGSDKKSVEIFSGLKEKSTVTTANIMFSGGVIHILDTVLTMPLPPSSSAIDSQLTALAGGLTSTNLVSAVDNLKDVTIFAPSNKAFQDIGSVVPTLSMMQLANILEYHVINGTVGYSSLLTTGLANESFPSLTGQRLNVEAVDGKVFVNSAQVTITDIIVSNGVMHVLDNVLNPSNQTATPIPTATTQAVAFAGVSSATNVPFTSGIVATTTAPSASTSTAGANAAAHSGVVGMVGAAALFGMVAAGL